MQRLSAAFVCLLLLLSAAPLTKGAEGVVYSNSFESAVGPEWSATNRDVTPIGSNGFLGQFGSESAVLTLSNLPAHANLTVSFDLYIIASWDGHGLDVGPDIWDLSVVGGPDLLHTTFSNVVNCEPGDRNQDFPDMYPGGDFPQRTGAVATNSLGFHFLYGSCGQSLDAGDTTYHLVYTFPHTSSTVGLDFSASLTGSPDEFWGIDNLVISASDVPTGVCTVDDLCPCEGPVSGGKWKNHREYMRCVTAVAEGLVRAGAMTLREKEKAVKASSHSDCGQK